MLVRHAQRSSRFRLPRVVRHCHAHIVAAFDHPATCRWPQRPGHAGLFCNPHLKTPDGLRVFANSSLVQAQKLTNQIIELDPSQLVDCIRLLDQLSDLLCKVIDLCGFIRMTHPDKHFVHAARECHQHMFEYMNVLNTSVDLYRVLDRVLHCPDVCVLLSAEELKVGHMLHRDFLRSGINLESHTRQEFVRLCNVISESGQQFVDGTGPAVDSVSFTHKELAGVFENDHTAVASSVEVPVVGKVASQILRSAHSSETRRKLWLAQRDSTHDQVHRLETVLRARGELARLMGYSSFAAYELIDKMAKCPANVDRFLSKLSHEILPRARNELGSLARPVNKPGSLATQPVQAWDRDYLYNKFLRANSPPSACTFSQYFSLGNVMSGLSQLFSRIYGIQFKPVQPDQGEVWHPSVTRLDVVSESEGTVGIIYCDLFQRQGKSPHAAHFTIRCCREVDTVENEVDDSPVARIGDSLYQLPIICLVCDFARNKDDLCLLNFHEVETLFHEMGHAIHSMLGRTKLHNVAGTRCATDFVEIPSVLMEKFARDETVLKLFAKHHRTGQPLPYDQFRSHLQIQGSVLENAEMYSQIELATLDQRLHSEVVFESDFDSTKISAGVEGLFSKPHGFKGHAQFGHLFGYGATYYSYLLDRAIADKVWTHLFARDPLSRDAGDKFRSQVLSWGGAKDPWACVSAVLDCPELATGDGHAMDRITHRLTCHC